MAKIRLVAILIGVSLLSACGATGHFYPVQGPLAGQTPVPVLTAKASGIFNSGSISVLLADGENCKGRWEVGQAVPQPTYSSVQSAPPASLADVWDAVYGQGFYVSHVLGSSFAHGTAHGDRGTVLYIEMYRVSPHPHDTAAPAVIRGVAKDTLGNIYKVAFGA
jgi:hypothetical protein